MLNVRTETLCSECEIKYNINPTDMNLPTFQEKLRSLFYLRTSCRLQRLKKQQLVLRISLRCLCATVNQSPIFSFKISTG